jgi:hypothetical protein
MVELPKPYRMIVDFVTGKEIPEVGSEANRQDLERYLVMQKNYAKQDIEVDAPIAFEVAGESYRSQVDLVVRLETPRGLKRFMAIKCAAGSLGSREREILAAARLLEDYQIPLAVVSDGQNAVVVDTLSGRKIGEGLDALPTKAEALKTLETLKLQPYPEERLERERLIFRTYDVENVNVARNLP